MFVAKYDDNDIEATRIVSLYGRPISISNLIKINSQIRFDFQDTEFYGLGYDDLHRSYDNNNWKVLKIALQIK
jgi:hypothetical protein